MIDGSEEHKNLFCKTFIETYRAYEPTELPWPELDAVSIDRLRAIPFWSAALAAERAAGIMVTTFAQTLEDPVIREAFVLQGVEETRHARLLDVMLQHYGIPIPNVKLPKTGENERAFIDFGYEECIDAFLGMGIFGLAREIQLFIPELTDIFEVILLEEARHVTFFVNWIAFERIRRGRGAMPAQAVSIAIGYVRAMARLVRGFAPAATQKSDHQIGFAAEGAFEMFDDATWRTFLQSAVDQNDHYMAVMDGRLMTPRILPSIARGLLKLPAFPRTFAKKAATQRKRVGIAA